METLYWELGKKLERDHRPIKKVIENTGKIGARKKKGFQNVT